MTEDPLPLAHKVQALIQEGQFQESIRLHQETVKERLDAAKRGEVINLSDLMASKEELDLEVWRRKLAKGA